jgi:hypothetical protein
MVVSLDMQGGEHKQEKIWIKKAITKIATIMSYIGMIMSYIGMELPKAKEPKAFVWKDSLPNGGPRPDSWKNRVKKNRKAKRARKNKRGY